MIATLCNAIHIDILVSPKFKAYGKEHIYLFIYIFIYLFTLFDSFNDAVMSSNSIVSNVHNEFESIMEGANFKQHSRIGLKRLSSTMKTSR
jgi:hypothetical protein